MNSGKVLSIPTTPKLIDIRGLFGSSSVIFTAKGTSVFYCETDSNHTFKARSTAGVINVGTFNWVTQGSSFTVEESGTNAPYNLSDLRVSEHIPLVLSGVIVGFGIIEYIANGVCKINISHALVPITSIDALEVYPDSYLEAGEQIEADSSIEFISVVGTSGADSLVAHTGGLKKKSNSGVGGGGGTPSGSTYTNPNPTPTTIGGIVAGSTFLNQTMQQMWDALLYPYQYPAFSDFKFDRPTVVEVGTDLSGHINATWATTNSSNIQPNTVDIDDITLSTSIVADTANDGGEAITVASLVHLTQADHTFRISAQNTQGGTFSRDLVFHWYFKVFYGNESTTTLDENGIEGLSDNLLTNTFARTYSYASGGGYKYVCYPTSFGTATNFTDVDTGFAVAMEAPYVVSVTNALGVTQDYRVHRTTNIINGALNMSVS